MLIDARSAALTVVSSHLVYVTFIPFGSSKTAPGFGHLPYDRSYIACDPRCISQIPVSSRFRWSNASGPHMSEHVVAKYSNPDGYEGKTSWEAAPVTVSKVKRGEKQSQKPPVDKGNGPELSVTSGPSRASGKARCWCFTMPGASDEDIERCRLMKAERVVVGKEVGQGGYVHLQGYVRFANPVSLGWWKLHFPTTHVEWRKGSESQATAYCRKDGNVVVDIGVDCDVRYVGLDKDTESEMVMDEIDNGAKYGQVRQRHRHFMFWHRKHVVDYMYDDRQLKADPDWSPVDFLCVNRGQ